jgi:CheY-like chemotaxis protein
MDQWLGTMRANPVVLLVEDNEDTRRVYGMILRHFGYEVEEVTNGLDAVAAARSRRPSLVLMDIGLPGLNGWQASRLLKADPSTAAIPLIAFSARVDSTADLGRKATFDGFILKPISPNALVRRVDAYLTLLGVPHPHAHAHPIDRPASDPPQELAG